MTEIIKQTASMRTRDGVRLDADIYRSDTDEELPILLMRQPYGRAIASTVVYAHPRWYAARDYIVVIQDVRGRGTSEGKFELFTHEIEDGFDTVNWVAQLPGSNGNVGMYGFSYQGMTQLYAAVHRPLALKAIAPAMVAYDLYADWAYENGAFCLYANLGWAIQLAAETSRLQGDEAAFTLLSAVGRNLPLSDSLTANPQIMQELAPDSFYHQWLNYNDPKAEYWQKRSPKYLIQNVDLPMLHVGGWFDPYLRGTLNLYQAMAGRGQHPQYLIVGPWAHLPWGRKLGAIDYGSEAQNPIDEIQIRWFDYFLKGKDTGLLAESPICLFEMGSNRWQKRDRLNTVNERIYYLTSNGLAGIREDGGMLREWESELSQQHDTDILVHDPWRPVPTLGGHAIFPGGSCDRGNLDCRSDILTYTSAPLTRELQISGKASAEIYCTADTPSFDLCAVLSSVYPDGRVMNFTQGYIRVEHPDSKGLVSITLQPTCMYIPPTHSLRLSISAACFPAYPVNPGTGQSPQNTRAIDLQIITLAIHSGADRPSRIRLSTQGSKA
jgi:uncharacterized protein